jgi:hypothetical protein
VDREHPVLAQDVEQLAAERWLEQEVEQVAVAERGVQLDQEGVVHLGHQQLLIDDLKRRT